MDKVTVLESIKKLKEESKKRKFSQPYDLIITFKDLDLKKVDNQMELFMPLHYGVGRKIKVCAIVGQELREEATKTCDKVIIADELDQYAGKKSEIKKIAREHDYFIAQANFMAKIATVFGRVLGPRGKMPNPKSGCVIPPKTLLKPLVEKLQKLIKVSNKKAPMIQIVIGRDDMKDEEVADNILTTYNSIIQHLPGEANNINKILLKFSMSKHVELKK